MLNHKHYALFSPFVDPFFALYLFTVWLASVIDLKIYRNICAVCIPRDISYMVYGYPLSYIHVSCVVICICFCICIPHSTGKGSCSVYEWYLWIFSDMTVDLDETQGHLLSNRSIDFGANSTISIVYRFQKKYIFEFTSFHRSTLQKKTRGIIF